MPGRVVINGLGSSRPQGKKGFRFVVRAALGFPGLRSRRHACRRAIVQLAAQGFDPWFDQRQLLPEQNWPRSVEATDFVVACFSRHFGG